MEHKKIHIPGSFEFSSKRMVIKMKKLGMASVGLFVISLLVYGSWFFNESAYNGKGVMLIATLLPVIGLLTAFNAKGALKTVGIIGNSLVLMWAVIIPFASTLFWNQP